MKRLYLTTFALLFSQILAAQEFDLENWHFGLGAGVTIPNVDNTSASIGPGWPDDQFTVDDIDTAALFSAFTGYTWQTHKEWFPSYSARLHYLYGLSSEVSGHIKLFSLPSMENYKYNYKVQSQALLGVLKLDIYQYKGLLPYISAGIGGAWNRFSDYHEQALPGVMSPRSSADFNSKTHGDLAYTVGAGIDFAITEALALGLEYNYGYFGNVKSGGSSLYPGENLESRLSTNMVLFNITYTLS